MTEYVVTRWYRAPEPVVVREYTSASTCVRGGIFAELLGRKPLFPGKDYLYQLNPIARVAGTPAEHETGFVSSEKARRYLHALPRFERVDFRTVYPDAAVEARFVDKMLAFDLETITVRRRWRTGTRGRHESHQPSAGVRSTSKTRRSRKAACATWCTRSSSGSTTSERGSGGGAEAS